MRENAFRDKYERYLSENPFDTDRKRKALTALAAKMARVIYAVIKNGSDYERFFERPAYQLKYFASGHKRLQSVVHIRQPDQVVKRDSFLQIDFRPSLVREVILLANNAHFHPQEWPPAGH